MVLGENDIEKILNDIGIQNSNVIYTGHPHLEDIVPIINRKLPLQKYYKRPMIFVLKEGKIGNEREFIENSPHWEKLLAFAHKYETGVKFIDYQKDIEILQKNDILVYIGDKGKEQAEYLIKDLGYEYHSYSIQEIKNNLKGEK